MEKIRKYTIITVILIILVIPILFGIYIDFLFVKTFNLIVILILFFGVLLILLASMLIAKYGYNNESIDKMKNHDVIDAFINNHKVRLWILFPLIMIIEELIFRYYLIGFLLNQLNFDAFSAILISSLIFSLFHIHTWFGFKNVRILLINLTFSLVLGLFNGWILITLGIFLCIIVHYTVAMLFYCIIYKRNFKSNNL